MNNPSLPWFRMYTDFLNDPKMIALAFEDQRHFIGILALKGDGALDQDCCPDLMDRIVAQRLWIDHAVIREVKKRLIAAGLIESNWQPVAWDKRQMRSDADPTGAERQRRYRERQKQQQAQEKDSNASRNAAVTLPDTEEDTDTEEEKNNNKPAQARAKKSSRKPDDLDFSAWPEPPSEQVWKDYKRLRAGKKAVITQTVIDRLGIEIHKASAMGLSVDDFLSECVLRGWQGGKASWLANDNQNNQRSGGAFDPLAYVNRNRTRQGAGDVIDI